MRHGGAQVIQMWRKIVDEKLAIAIGTIEVLEAGGN
jgi:hypothetical protein